MPVLHRSSLSRNLLAAEVDANFDLVSRPDGVVVARCVADGVTDQTAVIAAAIASLPTTGGTVLLPSGTIICNSLDITRDGVTLQGVASNGIAGGSSASATILKATPSSSNVVLQCIGTNENNRRYFLTLKDLTLWGSGNTFNCVNFKYCSYFRLSRVNFNNTQGSWIKLWDVWDSRFTDCDFTFGSSSNGTYPGVELYSESGSASTNEINFISCRFESFAGTAVALTGSNTNQIRIFQCKFESNLSIRPYLTAVNASALDIISSDFTSVYVGGVLTSLIDIATSRAVKIDAFFQCNGAGTTIAQYIKLVNTANVDLSARLAADCPAPTSTYVVNWDSAYAATFFARVQAAHLATTTFPYPPSIRQNGFLLSNGTTYTIGDEFEIELDAGGDVAGCTIVLPSSPTPRQTFSCYSTRAITTLTLTSAKTVRGGPTTMTANTFFSLRFNAATGHWQRIG